MSSAANRFVQDAIDKELASLGGHLLATYGEEAFRVQREDGGSELRPHPLGTLGGFLLETYGKGVDDGD